ncbi:hypothetical protein PLEOSDRAFT_160332 [Pleurotus ostreatus PC15]|uniref:ABC transporter domain-containing protein n=1 Tax=Pleurotus ostreatus (strain PC15) TaxID=1137138 RepID=A0A067NFF8_PLEO1|nr:hypothetical protein PLEOSDRAFT_160332 [Pleurotus ostreatus PC15]
MVDSLDHVDIGIPQPRDKNQDINIDDDGTLGLDLQSSGQTPALVKDLSLVLKEGEHLMITGSNGVGSRPLGSLAPRRLNSQTGIRPSDKGRKGLFVPQRVYMVAGACWIKTPDDLAKIS